MSTLATSFQLTHDLKPELATAPPEFQRQAFALAKGETIAFAPDERFALRSEATLILEFAPAWAPWSDAQSIAEAPCIAQLGTDGEPNLVLRVAVSRELDAILISSQSTPTPVRFTGNFAQGGRLVICIGPYSVKLFAKNLGDFAPQAFSLGEAPDGTLTGLTLGTADDPGSAPFAGYVGRLMLFDRNLREPIESRQRSTLIDSWFDGHFDRFYAALGAEAEERFAAALVGVAWSDFGPKHAPGFDFIPRELLWPERMGTSDDRWVLDAGDHPPLRVSVPGQTDHGIYSSFNLFCLTRFDGAPCLWGDGGQRFTLSYTPERTVRAVQRGTVERAAILNRPNADRIELIAQGWSNTSEHMFATYTCPEGTSLSISPADLWPAKIALVRVPLNYDRSRGQTTLIDQDQPWKGAFSKRLPQIGQSARGFVAAQLSALNPGASDGAQASEQYYLFAQPSDSSRNYRVDFIATPYYLFSSAPNFKVSNDGTIAYQSAKEAMASESTSLGVNVGVGESKLFSLGITNSSSNQSTGSSESLLAVSRTRALKYVLTLDRRWASLSGNFMARVLSEADRVLAGDNDPPPFHNLFFNFGTHYANAITYGAQSGTVQMFDVTTLGAMVKSGSSINMGLKVPIPETPLTVGLDAGHEKEASTGQEMSVRKESRATIEVGSDADPVPIFLDLRPIVELMQPPYVLDERMRRTLDAARRGWEQYCAQQQTTTAPEWETPFILQARLKSIIAIGTAYLRARAFLAGIAEGSDWSIVAPANAVRSKASPIWMSTDPLRISLLPYMPAAQPVVTLSLPRTHTTPAIGFTGACLYTKPDAIAKKIEARHPFVGFGGGGGVARAPASAGEILAREDELGSSLGTVSSTGTDWIGTDALGHPLAQDAPDPSGFYADECEVHVFRAKLKLDDLKPGPTFVDKSVSIDSRLVVTFEVRLVDPLSLLDDRTAGQFKFS